MFSVKPPVEMQAYDTASQTIPNNFDGFLRSSIVSLLYFVPLSYPSLAWFQNDVGKLFEGFLSIISSDQELQKIVEFH